MDVDRNTLETGFSRLLGWEKRKRCEAILTVALFYALVGALVAPLFVPVSRGWAWVAPAAIFVLLTPWLLFTRRWREQDTARALAALDRRLHLEERATTAWELLRRNETKAVALLVLSQASDRLKSLDPRALFPRARSWYGWLLTPLAAAWLAMLFFDPRFDLQRAAPAEPPSLSQKLREFARRLQEKAQSEGLPKTLEAARQLERLAQQAIAAGATDEKLRSELAGMGSKLAADRKAAGEAPFGAGESRQQLEDLKAELEAAREMLDPARDDGQSLRDRLAGLPRVQKQLERREGGAQGMSRGEMQALVDKLSEAVSGELDRRALMETEEFLKQLAQPGQREQRDARGRSDTSRDQDAQEGGRREKRPGSTAGEEPGSHAEQASPRPDPQGVKRSQVQGPIGDGERSGIFLKAKPVPGMSRLSQDEVIANYQRQAEAELSTEKIPQELKDTIRNYFLSLDTGETAKHGIR